MSHVYYEIVSSLLSDIDAEYGNIVKMNITWGNIHKNLKITIDYHFTGKVKFFIVNYIGKVIKYIPEDMRGESETLAAHHIFDMAEDVTKLS